MANTDKNGNKYLEAKNVRVSYVKQKNRASSKNWPGSDVIRIQAYTGEGQRLHQGAEYPVDDSGVAALIDAIEKIYVEGRK
jgi:hypothetical protein